MKLLTPEISSPKLAKTEGGKYLTAILYLAGAGDSRLCPASTAGCRDICLITESGRGVMSPVRQARQAKTDFLFNNRTGFDFQLAKDINALRAKAKRLGKRPAIRLNGGSDLDWYRFYEVYQDIIFWDYTKRPDLAVKNHRLMNVHMTYSENENTTDRIRGQLLDAGINIAMVFDIWSRHGGALPEKIGNVPVIDGDTSDLRFLDPKGVIVGLRLKSAKTPTKTKNTFLKRA
jgi:hypothetical protein